MVGLSGLDAMSTFFEKKASLREASGGNINSFFLKDGETKIFRFVGNDVKTVKFHNFVTCRDGKPRSFICPNQGEDGLYDESGPCLICKYVPKMKDGKKTKNYPTDRGIALAVLREAKTEKVDGKTVTKIVDVVHDSEVEVEIDGKKVKIANLPVVGIVNQGTQFWENVIPIWARYGSISDRDFLVERRGEGLQTKYSLAPLDRADSPDLDTDEKVAERYAEAVASHMTLDAYIARFSSLDWQRLHAPLPESEQNNPPAKEDNEEHSAETTETGEGDSFDSLQAKLKALAN